MIRSEYENFKELIEMIPKIRETVKRCVDKNEQLVNHNQERLIVEVNFYQKGLSFLQGKWNVSVLYMIYFLKEAHFNELKNLIQKISSRSLTDSLRILKKKKLIFREVLSKAPVRVKYKITNLGEGMFQLLLPLLFYNTFHSEIESSDLLKK
ncbi:MAG TPA: helix-turn-helix domain-containing protein [Candidatus Lokiarchaeia archaeon]